MNQHYAMNKIALSLLAGTVCLSTILPLGAFAAGGPSPGQGYRQRPDFGNMTSDQKQNWQAQKDAHHQKMMDELGLTPDQASKIKTIREQNHSQAKSLHDQLQGKRQSLMEYMSSDSADPAKAKAMQQDIDQLQGQLSTLRMNTWFEMKKNLTPEQLSKMQALREQHHQNRGQGGPSGFSGYGSNKPTASFSGGGQPRFKNGYK
jgi:Spy/CpxP family protein refolding chaperone